MTFDDLPVASRHHELDFQRRVTARLLDALEAQAVPATGFVNESKLLDDDAVDPQRVALLDQWLRAGHELGNHGFGHLDMHRTPLKAYQQDVLRGEAVTRELVESRGATLRFFRHPFLHSGTSLQVKRGFERFLARKGYRVAPVTIDNSEWIFARAYERATDRNDAEARAAVARAYLDYMTEKFTYFEEQTRTLFHRPIRHVLLLHANALNADHFDGLARMLRSRGYRFVTLERALEDPAYRSEDRYVGGGGITWLHRWALTRGVDPEFFSGEPRTPQFVLDEAGVESE